MPAPSVTLVTETSVIPGTTYDAVVVVASDPKATGIHACDEASAPFAAADKTFGSGPALVLAEGGLRYVIAPTGALDDDTSDVRSVFDAARDGARRARDAGAATITLTLSADLLRMGGDFADALHVAISGCLFGLYAPIQERDHAGDAAEPVSAVGVFARDADEDVVADAIRRATAVDAGRRLACDLGGADPERMAPIPFAAEVRRAFEGVPRVTVSVVDDTDVIARDFPLAMAVSRCAMAVPRHHPRIVRVEYRGDGPIERQVMFAGKGVTYDTGGADVKAGGIMANMSRDKCGAAAAAGFVRAAAELAPANLRVVALLGLVRNSIGADAYVADEIITSHAGRRVLVVNTDAEGRMVMGDLLSHLRLEALQSREDAALKGAETTLHSIATLTGHAVVAVGHYSVALDNGPARRLGRARGLQEAGHAVGDPFEVSTLRRDDVRFVAPKTRQYDVLQCNTAPSSRTPRGHQFPMAFLLRASGLDAHGLRAEQPIAYTHLDIAGSATKGGVAEGYETGAPVPALVAHYITHAPPARAE